MKGTQFPRTPEEGFRQCMMLSMTCLRDCFDTAITTLKAVDTEVYFEESKGDRLLFGKTASW